MSVSIADRLRREVYLARFDYAMTDYPRGSRLRRELRAEVTATAHERGMRSALTDLGDPRVLAAGYLAELDRPVPRWIVGAVWGALAVVVLMWLVTAFWGGTLNALAKTGGGTMTQESLGGTWTFISTDRKISVTGQFSWGWAVLALVAFLVPFVLGARAWRWRPARRASATPVTSA